MKLPAFRRLLLWIPVFALSGAVFYHFKFAPLPVIGHKVNRGEIVAEVMGTGTLEARVRTVVSARIQERLTEVLADQGDLVKSGQLLARLDDAEAKQQVAIAAATLAAARLTAERVRSDLARSEAVLAQAHRDHQRMVGLVVTKAVSQSDADRSSEALLVAEADLKRSNAAIAEADSQIVVAEKSLRFREEQLAFTRILAPYDGLIIRRDRDAGEVMVPGASLMEIISLDEIWVSAWVDETAMQGVHANQPARIRFRSAPMKNHPGKVSRLGRETDRETREFLVDVQPVSLPENWSVGQRAEVFIETEREKDAILLPSGFINWKDGRAGVFIHSGGKARWREISPGLRGEDRISVLAGLDVGDEVLRLQENQTSPLVDGRRITVR